MSAERTSIDREELFRLSCCVFEEVLQVEEFHNENCRDALTMFSRRLDKKMFADPPERYYTPDRIKKMAEDFRRRLAASANA